MIAGEGTQVIHRSASWLENDTPQEVLRLKMLLESGPGADVRAGSACIGDQAETSA
jgi:hypothetical protein